MTKQNSTPQPNRDTDTKPQHKNRDQKHNN